MDALKALSSLHCELKIMKAKKIQLTNSSGHLFVRCYLSAGNNKRVHVDTREVSSNGDVSWNESFSLDCTGTKQSMNMIMHETILLELRWRSKTINNLFGRSQLVGRAEVPWRGAFESPNMEIERCVMMESAKRGAKAPSVCVSMKIEVPFNGGLVVRKKKWDESCECCHGDCCNNTCDVDSECFLIGAALDAF